jgi:hypothetical protein
MNQYVELHFLQHVAPPFPAQESMLQEARALFRGQDAEEIQSLVAAKIEGIRHFDIAGMERALAICSHGRSGSILLASYLDGHDDIIMLPAGLSEKIYPFFERYASLSLRDKLIAYPVFIKTFYHDFSKETFRSRQPIIMRRSTPSSRSIETRH